MNGKVCKTITFRSFDCIISIEWQMRIVRFRCACALHPFLHAYIVQQAVRLLPTKDEKKYWKSRHENDRYVERYVYPNRCWKR